MLRISVSFHIYIYIYEMCLSVCRRRIYDMMYRKIFSKSFIVSTQFIYLGILLIKTVFFHIFFCTYVYVQICVLFRSLTIHFGLDIYEIYAKQSLLGCRTIQTPVKLSVNTQESFQKSS